MQDIINFLKEPNTIVVFDIDGVLSPYEYGNSWGHKCPDNDWENFVNKYHPYLTQNPIPIIQNFIKEKDINNIYVCSVAEEFERKDKEKFCIINYGIPKENIYFVKNKKDKINILREIHNKRNYQENMIAMVEDSVEILDQIYDESSFVTVHVSSFFK